MEIDEFGDVRYTTDEILQMIRNKREEFGLAPDYNYITDKITSYMSGASQAVYNIVNKPDCIQHWVNHHNDRSAEYDDSEWYQGYGSIMEIFVKYNGKH
jgi:hypothetical protein